MKTKLLYPVALIVINLGLTPAHGGETPNAPVVQNEYAKQQAQFEAQLMKAKKTLRELEGTREKAILESKAMAQTDLTGLKALKRYDTLMSSRYATEQGEFQSWRPLAASDVENINRLFETYLHMKPLWGRISAGHAHRTLDWGMTRLEEMAKMHNSPAPDNNSDLEIVTHQIKDAETSVKNISSTADRLGMKLNANPNEDEGSREASSRVPASDKNDKEDLSTP